MNFKIVFHLDGSGVYVDPNEPIHLDALLTWSLAPRLGIHGDLPRDRRPEPVPLPLNRRDIGGHWLYAASALFPDGPQGEDLQFWRKRFRQNRAELSTGSPNLTNGTYRDWNAPMPIMLLRRMVAYASGSRNECKRLLRDVQYLGKKRAHGYGKVIGIELDEMEHDWSIVRNGIATRWLPDESGTRLVRLRPPYWNSVDRVMCCEVGDPVRSKSSAQ